MHAYPYTPVPGYVYSEYILVGALLQIHGSDPAGSLIQYIASLHGSEPDFFVVVFGDISNIIIR